MNKFVIAILMLLLSGCGTYGVLNRTSNFDPKSESIFVIGISPENFWIETLSGEIEGGTFKFHWNGSAVQGWPTDGYLVGKVKGGELMAITKIDKVKQNSAFKGKQYVPCAGVKTLTFKAPVGKVLYITDIHYSLVNEKLSIEYQRGFEAAKLFIDEHYPNLRGKIEDQKDIAYYPTNVSCTDISIIII